MNAIDTNVLVYALDDGEPAICHAWLGQVEPFHRSWTGQDAQKRGRLDAAQDVVLNENPTKRRVSRQDVAAHVVAAIGEIHADDAELDDFPTVVQGGRA